MKTGESGATWVRCRRAARRGGLLLLCAVCVGCAAGRASVEKKLMADRQGERRGEGVSEHYLVTCPDVIEVQIALRPELSGQYPVGPDGRIDLGEYGKLRVEGRPLAEVARLLAAETGTVPDAVKVRVVEFRSQVVFLFGQVLGWQKAVPYRGQETVVDLLQRVGGITPGAAPDEVCVVRAHLDGNQRPELFKVDLKAIVLKQDDRTNLRLLPFDQVYVGETRQAVVERVVPPWFRPLYRTLTNTRLPRSTDSAEAPKPSQWVAGSRQPAASSAD
jgi:polysaccharide biosynthesis/export protein